MNSSDSSSPSDSFHFGSRGKGGQFLNVRREINRRRGLTAIAIDGAGHLLANPVFFALVLAAHLLWIVLNAGVIPGLAPWDPYPFVFLATLTSVEAPFIALLVLMRQHRDNRIDELREEIDLQIAFHVAHEATAIIRMLAEVHEKLAIETKLDTATLEMMKQDLQPEKLLQRLKEDLDQVEGEDIEQG